LSLGISPYLIRSILADKSFFRNLGFSKGDFHAITWLTSWALSGTDDHALDPDLPAPADKLPER
jgi:hypothetical protein